MHIIMQYWLTFWFWFITIFAFMLNFPLSLFFDYNKTFLICFKFIQLFGPIEVICDGPPILDNSIIVSNHNTIVDFIFILIKYPNTKFAAINWSIWDYCLPLKYVFTNSGNLLFDSGNSYAQIKEWIQDTPDSPIWIFPTGSIVNNEVHSGAFSIAGDLKKTIKIVKIENIKNVFNRNGFIRDLHPVRIRFVESGADGNYMKSKFEEIMQ